MKANKIIIAISLIAIIILGIFLAGCKEKEEEEVIKIGAVLPITGVESRVGDLSKNGLMMAENEINMEGGIDGKQIEVLVEDYKSETKEGVTVYNYIKNIHAVPVILTIGSPVSMAMSPLVNEDEIILFSISSTSSYSTPNDFTYRMVPSAEKEGKNMANLTYNKLGIKRLAVIYLNNDFGVGAKNGFISEYTNIGGEVFMEEAFNQEETDFRSYLTKIKGKDTDTLYIASWGKQAGMIAKQAEEMGMDIQFLCGQACQNPDLIKEGGNAVEGLIFPYTYADKSASFYEDYSVKYGEEANQIAERMYDFLKISAKIIGDCGAENKECLLNQLQSKEFNATSAKLKFDENGDPVEDMVLYVVRDSKFVLYEE